jgi:hypothetical protein
MCHIESTFGVLRPKAGPVPFGFEKTKDGVYSRRKLLLSEAAQRQHGLLNIAFRLHYPDVSIPDHGSAILSALYLARRALQPEYRELLHYRVDNHGTSASRAQHLGNIVGSFPQLAAFGVDYFTRNILARRKLPYILAPNGDGTFPLEFNSEQTPLATNRLTLGSAHDMFGVIRVHGNWQMCAADIDSICSAYRLLKRVIDRAGGCTLEFDEQTLVEHIANSRPVGGHHIGAARMSANVASGVVDVNCAVHGIPNLFIASAAVFPTASHANPTLTIVALSVRLASHLKTSLAGRL